MSKPSTDSMNEILAVFGVSAGDVEIVPERDPLETLPNGITDAECDQMAKHANKAMRTRLNSAVTMFNLQLLACGIDTPWRRLLEDFRDDLECTTRLQPLMIDGKPLTLPDGTPQMVCIDSGKFPGDPDMREALWKLHEILEEIEEHHSLSVSNGLKGGRKPQYDEDEIKRVIRGVLDETKAKRVTDSWIVQRVRNKLNTPEMKSRIRLDESKNDVPGATKINGLLKEVRAEKK